jgi:diguanylate cyclase
MFATLTSSGGNLHFSAEILRMPSRGQARKTAGASLAGNVFPHLGQQSPTVLEPNLMFVLPAAIGTLLLVNLLCACIALAVGFAAGVWFLGSGQPVTHNVRTASPRDREAERDAERAMMASSRLKDLANSIATDIGLHTSQVEAVTADLRDLEKHPGGAEEAVCAAIGKILAANGQLQKQLEVAETQIASQAAEIRIHETEARTDSLTALANRRAFDDELQRRFAEWQRKKTPFALLLMDIDHFKKFNDTHGHQAGDEVLRSVGKVLGSVPREMDVPCRYGGEEFAVILPATTAREGTALAERLRLAVERSTTTWEGKSLKVTGSIGLAEVSANDTTAMLVKRADDALYRSKQAGRNCGHLHDGRQCVPITPGLENRATSGEQQVMTVGKISTDRVPNQGVFVDELRRRLAESHRFGIPLSVMYLTLESLPSIEREYGPAITKLALDAVVQAVATTLREMDLLARWDAGHFAVMLPGSTEQEARLVAKRLRTVMRTCVVPLKDGQLKLDLRFGVAQAIPEDKVPTIMARAQEAAKMMAAEPAAV